MSKPYYQSDLTDAEWQQIEPLLPPEKPLGNHRSVRKASGGERDLLPRR